MVVGGVRGRDTGIYVGRLVTAGWLVAAVNAGADREGLDILSRIGCRCK